MARRCFGRWPVRLLTGVIRGYQIFISPYLGPCCRFTPSCSHYAVTALERHGFWRGGWLTFRRVLRCQPWCRGGYDPVPPARPDRKKSPGGGGEADSGNRR